MNEILKWKCDGKGCVWYEHELWPRSRLDGDRIRAGGDAGCPHCDGLYHMVPMEARDE